MHDEGKKAKKSLYGEFPDFKQVKSHLHEGHFQEIRKIKIQPKYIQICKIIENIERF